MRIIIFILALALASHARAANISVVPPDGSKPALIAIQGTFEYEDAEKFTKSIARFENGIVVFESDGGNLIAGLQIGRTIFQKKFMTYVPTNVRCASACALAWLGGTRRFMGASSRIGFHAAFDARSKQESGAANALVGAFLKEIGLDYPAVFYITQAPPQSMTWLSLEDAARLGIQVTLLDSPAQRPSQAEGPPPARSNDVQMKNRALSVVAAIFRKWSETTQIEWLEGIYADKVSYYGNVRERDQIIADKAKFAEIWPERRFRMRFETFAIECDELSARCKLEGVVDWQIRNSERQEARTGATTFTYVLAFGHDSFRIVAESGVLIRRESSSERPQNPERQDPDRQERQVQSDSEEVRHLGE